MHAHPHHALPFLAGLKILNKGLTHLAIFGWPEDVKQGSVHIDLAVCVVHVCYLCCAASGMHLGGHQLRRSGMSCTCKSRKGLNSL
jgi:hypothetical protein